MAEAPAASASPNNAQSAVNGSPNPVQGEEVQESKLTLEAIRELVEETIRPVRAELTRVREGKFPKPKAQAQDPADRTLTERLNAIEAKEARMAEKSKKSAIRDAIGQMNISPDLQPLLLDHILAQNGSEIVSTGDDEFGWTDNGLYVDQPKSITALVEKVVKSRLGDRAKPPVAVPRGQGLRASVNRAAPIRPTSYRDVPLEERLKMTGAARGQLFREAMESAGR